MAANDRFRYAGAMYMYEGARRVRDDGTHARALGLVLARLRVGLGLSGQAVGRLAGVSGATISRIECGRYTPSLALLERLGAALGLAPGHARHLREDVAYTEALLTRMAVWGAANRGSVQVVLCTLGDLQMDEAARRQFVRACLAIRRDLGARQAG